MTHDHLLRDLQSEMWDFYKDVHGIRPRHWTDAEWASMEFLQAQREGLIKVIESMAPEQKIAEGWGSDPDYAFEHFMDLATGPARG